MLLRYMRLVYTWDLTNGRRQLLGGLYSKLTDPFHQVRSYVNSFTEWSKRPCLVGGGGQRKAMNGFILA